MTTFLCLFLHLLTLLTSCTSPGQCLGEEGGSSRAGGGGEALPVASTRVVYPFRTDQNGQVISPYVTTRLHHPDISAPRPHASSHHPHHPDVSRHHPDTSRHHPDASRHHPHHPDASRHHPHHPDTSRHHPHHPDAHRRIPRTADITKPTAEDEDVGGGEETLTEKPSANDDADDKLYIVINNADEDLFLNLTANTRLVTPYTVIEWVLEGGRRVIKTAGASSGGCFYTGRLNSSSHSLVAVSNCGGLTGYIQTDDVGYFIEPLRRNTSAGGEGSDGSDFTSPGPQPHLIYKVEAITSLLNLSLRQDQEFQGEDEQEEEEEMLAEEMEEEATALELDYELKRRKRSSAHLEERRSVLRRRRRFTTVPKFMRRRPKFAPSHSERRGRSTKDAAETAHPSDAPGRLTTEEERDPAAPHTQETNDEIESTRNAEKRRRRRRKNVACRRKREERSIAINEGENNTDNDEECKEPGSKRRTIMEERAKRREERRNRRRQEREERKREKERRRQEKKRRRRQEARKRRRECREARRRREGGGGGGDEGSGDVDGCDLEEEERRKRRNKRRQERQRRRKERQKRRKKNKKTTSQEEEEEEEEGEGETLFTSRQDPFEGQSWDGYSPDMWEAQVAAGMSGLQEVWVGPEEVLPDPPKWLELVVAVDRTVIAFHGDEEVEKYVFTLFNIVSAIYEDPSLEASLQLVMLRIIFYKDAAQDQVREGQAKKSLEAVNRWAERLYRVSPKHLQHDLGVWLTRADLGGPSGYAPVAGVCQPGRSCTLNRDEGLTSAFIIAHEMAHVLGLSHDGDAVAGNTCEQEGFQGSVMAPLVAATFSRFHWSSCSRAEYHSNAKDWSCLLNQPEWENATTVHSTIHYQYSLHDQCRMEFGHGYGLCASMGVTDPCTHLWCSNSSTPHHCKTKKGPPLEGTTCGEQKWCRHGFCVSMGQEMDDMGGESPVRHNPQDGGWGAWSQWGPCSRTCGTGVAFRTRVCDNPKPAWGGRRCRGKREEWRVCGREQCPAPRRDFRAQQCALLSRIVDLDPRRTTLTWLPYEPKRKKKKCRISCYSHATNEVYIGREYVVDGTPCSYDDPSDICVQGKCVSLGCDGVVGSRVTADECGMCGGDGGTCTRHHQTYHQRPPQDYSLVATLPAGAWNILVREEMSTTNFLALRDNSSFFLNGGRSQEPSKSFISEGAKFVYSSRADQETLRARGPLLQPVSLLIHGTREREDVQVTTTYLTQPQEEHYQWEVGPYTACSVTCGGGQQHQTLVCRDRRTDRQVFHDRCHHLSRPHLNSTSCNDFGCEAKWVTGSWEHCSTTCGPAGVQQRMVFCVTLPEATSSNWTQGIVDPQRCNDTPRPEVRRPCLRDPCPGTWTERGWTECSSSCGEGVKQRLWECVGGGSSGNEVTYECGPQPREEQTCLGSPCPSPPCLRDESTFCQLPVLHRYCQMPKYRELCCHTCANVVY